MSAGKLQKSKKTDGKVYLRKRTLVAHASKAIQQAAKESMEVMGYVVVAEDGWIIKKFKDGRIQKIERLEKKRDPVVLD